MKPFKAIWILIPASILLFPGCKKGDKITFDELNATLRGSWIADDGRLGMNFISDINMVIKTESSIDTIGYMLSDYDPNYPSTKFHIFLLQSCDDYLCPAHLHIRHISKLFLNISEYCEEDTCSESVVFLKQN
jgi:hypothetical protein